MALKMAFTDASGNVNPNAYWRAVQVNIGVTERQCHIVLYAYKDADAKLAGKSPLIGAIRTYLIGGDEFTDLYTQHVTPGGPNLFQMVYEYAKNKRDVPNGQGGLKSFFDGAEDI